MSKKQRKALRSLLGYVGTIRSLMSNWQFKLVLIILALVPTLILVSDRLEMFQGQRLQLQPSVTPTPSPTPTLKPMEIIEQRTVPNTNTSSQVTQKGFSEDKQNEIDRINKRIEVLLSLKQDNRDMQKAVLDAFHKCEKDQNLRCMEFSLQQFDEIQKEINKYETQIQNLELQRSILQSGL